MFANLGYDEMNEKNKKDKEDRMSFLNKIKEKAKQLELENIAPEEASKKLEAYAKKLKEEEERKKAEEEKKKKLSIEEKARKELETIITILYDGLIPDPEYPFGIVFLKKNPFYKGSERRIVHAKTLSELERKINKIIQENADKNIYLHNVDRNYVNSRIKLFESLWDKAYLSIYNNKLVYKVGEIIKELRIKNGVIEKYWDEDKLSHIDEAKWDSENYNYTTFRSNACKLTNVFSNLLNTINFTRIIEIF